MTTFVKGGNQVRVKVHVRAGQIEQVGCFHEKILGKLKDEEWKKPFEKTGLII
jgi:hypothetical protein